MKRQCALVIPLLLLCAALCLPAREGAGAEIEPFNTGNQSPLVQVFGLPAPESALLLAPGEYLVRLAVDGASNSTVSENARELVYLDGESWRTTITVRRGFSPALEGGIEVPLLSHSGGFLDGFIEGWHDAFNLPDGDREFTSRNRLTYLYRKDGTVRLRLAEDRAGLGDLRLHGALQLYRDQQKGRALSLRAALKLPTGESDRLLGSGSTDLSLWGSARQDLPLERWGEIALFGSAGALIKSRGDIVPDQARHLVGFGALGAGWSPWRSVSLKLQLSWHTPFYRGSELRELGGTSLMLTSGGTVALSERTSLDIGVSEDVLVRRSPDVALHLSLSRRF